MELYGELEDRFVSFVLSSKVREAGRLLVLERSRVIVRELEFANRA